MTGNDRNRVTGYRAITSNNSFIVSEYRVIADNNRNRVTEYPIIIGNNICMVTEYPIILLVTIIPGAVIRPPHKQWVGKEPDIRLYTGNKRQQ